MQVNKLLAGVLVSQPATISRAHKIKLKPNREQERYFNRACGTRRFAFNWALEKWNQQYESHKLDPEANPRPSWMALAKQFNQFKQDEQFAWIKEVAARIPERAIRDVGTAWANYFKALKRGDRSVQRPRFARKGVHDRFYVHNANLRFDDAGKHVHIEKLGPVRCREAPRFNGKIMSGTVSRAADGWYISVQMELPHVRRDHPSPGEVGIDMGVANQVALSDGQTYQLPLDRLTQLQARLRRAQKALSRKWSGKIKKGHADRALRDAQGQLLPKSKRFIAQSRRLARLHQQIANVRLDALHKLSTFIADHYDVVAIEDLKLRNMTASAKGDAEQPGRNVKAKAGLNRAMLNAALRQFRILLEYKADALGGHVQAVDAAYTSQTCSACGHVARENRPTQARFCCVKCGYEENADVNAAKNILARLKQGPV